MSLKGRMNILSKMLCIWLCIVPFTFSKPPRITGNRLPSKPYISGDGFRSMADHVYDETDQSLVPGEVRVGDIVFVKSDKLGSFFTHIHPHIQEHYILISHNSDAEAPGQFAHYLEDEKIIAWFGQNPSIMGCQKFIPIPIGIANRYVHNHGNVQNFKQFTTHQDGHKDCLLGYNFKANNNRVERAPLLQMFPPCDYVRNISAGPHLAYLSNMSHAKYILSPRGNGLDCHRTWEALIVGTIPILKSSMLDELLDGLPVLIVKDWCVVDELLLEDVYESKKIAFKEAGMEKITHAYWKNRLSMCQQEARKSSV